MKLKSVLLLGAVLCGARLTWSASMVSPAPSYEFTTTDISMIPADSYDLVSAKFSEPSSGRYDSFSSHAWRESGKQRGSDNLTIVPTPEAAPMSFRLTEPTCLTALGSGMLVLGGLGFRRRGANTAGCATVDTERYAGGSLDQTVRTSRTQNRSATANPAGWQTFKGEQVRDCLRDGQGV
jgi:hypothetical protein